MKKILVILSVFVGLAPAAERMVLAELFTSTTCPPCVSANATLTGLLSQKEDYLVVVRNHMYWPNPGNDPFYNYNISDNNTRRSFYGTSNINAVPKLVVDGEIQGSSGWGTTIDERHDVDSPLQMEVYRSFQPAGFALEQGQGKGLVAVTNQADSTLEFSLFVALTESNIAYTGTNGDPIHNQVMIEMLPEKYGRYGTEITVQPGKTEVMGFDFSVFDTIPFLDAALEPTGEVHVTDAANCELAAWAQKRISKDVLQGGKVDVTGSQDLSVSNIELIDATEDGRLAPGEQAQVHLTVGNHESGIMRNVKVFVEVDNDSISVIERTAVIDQITAGGSFTLDGEELLIKADEDYDGGNFNLTCYAGTQDGSLGYGARTLGVEETLEDNDGLVLRAPSIAPTGALIELSSSVRGTTPLKVDLVDVSGRRVQVLYTGPASGLGKIRLPKTSSGLYFIKARTPTGYKTSKIILLD